MGPEPRFKLPAIRRLSVFLKPAPSTETLQLHAAGHGSDLLTMGGYGHSRLRVYILGGATEGVLSDLRMPVLVSH